MSRHICQYCGSKRDDKFMKKSPLNNDMFCFREVAKYKNFHLKENETCYGKMVKFEKLRILQEAKLIGLDVQGNLISQFKMYKE